MLVQHNKDSCFAFAASSHKAQDSRQFGIFKAVSLSAKKLKSVNISNKQACTASTALFQWFIYTASEAGNEAFVSELKNNNLACLYMLLA